MRQAAPVEPEQLCNALFLRKLIRPPEDDCDSGYGSMNSMLSRLKTIIHWCLILICGVLILPFGILATLEKYLIHRDMFFILGAQISSLVPSPLGDYVRRAYYSMTLDRFHPSAILGFGSYFSKRGARIGKNAGAGAYCVLGLVDIEEDVRIASRVSIISGIHTHGGSADLGTNKWTATEFTRVHIGAGTWIGEGAVVGADIGRGALISAGAVVLSPVPDGVMVMGNPARSAPARRAAG